jgi:Tol biopolymer transport system component
MRKQCGTGPDPSRDEAAALYVANTDGAGLHQITAYGQADSHPGGSIRWSPDGTKILSPARTCGVPEVCVGCELWL